MSEFSLIKYYFSELSQPRQDVLLGIGDDCALLKSPTHQMLAVTIDTLVAGIHFFPNMPAADLGYKSLAVNLSDLAAMGAEPAWVTLALTLPSVKEAWLAEFCVGFAALMNEYNVQLVGGDTTKGPLSITVQAHGFVPPTQALRRDKAKVGDMIYVTGSLGDAGAGLKILQQNQPCHHPWQQQLTRRLYRPTPRIREGIKLRGIANAAIDISDGLAADLSHILERSKVGAKIRMDQLPLSDSLCQAVDKYTAMQLALTAGDDYELCFTVPKAHEKNLQGLNINCTCIGEITGKSGLDLQLSHGQAYDVPEILGYQHFE